MQPIVRCMQKARVSMLLLDDHSSSPSALLATPAVPFQEQGMSEEQADEAEAEAKCMQH
jgi:hypothetical protein